MVTRSAGTWDDKGEGTHTQTQRWRSPCYKSEIISVVKEERLGEARGFRVGHDSGDCLPKEVVNVRDTHGGEKRVSSCASTGSE